MIALLSASCSSNDDISGKESMTQTQEAQALTAIKNSFGSKVNEYGVTLFVNHHLEELGGDYWKELTGIAKPSPQQVLDQLIVINKWESAGVVNYDFSLPNRVTQYVISVHFDGNGHIQEITMES